MSAYAVVYLFGVIVSIPIMAAINGRQTARGVLEKDRDFSWWTEERGVRTGSFAPLVVMLTWPLAWTFYGLAYLWIVAFELFREREVRRLETEAEKRRLFDEIESDLRRPRF